MRCWKCKKKFCYISNYIYYIWNIYTGWPTKISLFFFGNNFYKNKETFKLFSPQILEVYRNLLVETTLESINNYVCSMHHAAVWQHRCNSNIKIVHNSIEHLLWNPSDFFSDDTLSCLWISFTNSVFQVPLQKIVRRKRSWE